MALRSGTLRWNIEQISNALNISIDDTRAYFTDGRRVSFILERRLAEIIGGKLAPSEGAGYDLLDLEGSRWEVRSISRGGIYFCPSYMVGSGRNFDENGFRDKLNQIEGYIVSDIEKFPVVPYWIIPKNIVLAWWDTNSLGTTTKISRKNALQLIQEANLD